MISPEFILFNRYAVKINMVIVFPAIFNRLRRKRKEVWTYGKKLRGGGII